MRPQKQLILIMAISLLVATIACSGPLTNREKGGLIGAGLGAGTGAIIGSTVGYAAAGAIIGGPVGLIAGAIVGDQITGREQQLADQQKIIDVNQAEIERLKKENERLRQQQGEW